MRVTRHSEEPREPWNENELRTSGFHAMPDAATASPSSPPEPWLPQESESDDHENESEHERQVEQRHPHDRADGVEDRGYRKGWGRP
jgi:hypothetical protein